jgi:TRAP-type uncharacterized transport system fused permease subunit
LPLVATVSILTTIVLSWFSPARGHRIGLRGFLDACYETVFGMAPLAMAVIGAGIIIGSIELTGLSGKFSLLLSMLGGGYLLPSLFFGMVVLILLGMGMPTPAVYLMGAALIAPHLVQQFGLPMLGTHMWLVYFASMSAITPPVAVACFAAGAIAQADPMRVGLYACRLAVVGFVLPFFFLFNPAILLQGDALQIGTAACFALVMVIALAVAVNGWTRGHPLSWWLRALFALLGLVIIYPYPPLQAGAALLAVVIYGVLARWGRGRAGQQITPVGVNRSIP